MVFDVGFVISYFSEFSTSIHMLPLTAFIYQNGTELELYLNFQLIGVQLIYGCGLYMGTYVTNIVTEVENIHCDL